MLNKANDILNKLFKVYNRNAIEDKNVIAAKTLSFIQDRLQFVIGQLDSVEKNIQSYKTKEGIYNLGSQAELYLGTVKELDKKNSDVDGGDK